MQLAHGNLLSMSALCIAMQTVPGWRVNKNQTGPDWNVDYASFLISNDSKLLLQ